MLAELFDLFDWRIAAPTFLICCIVYWIYQVKGPGLPPGPFPLPIVGNLFAMDGAPFDQIMLRWKEKYGDVFMFYIGSQRMVHVCGLENIKSFFLNSGDSFIDRPRLFGFKKATKGFKGISFSSGTLWKDNRKFGMTAMRDMMGAGRQSLQDKVVEEGVALRELLAEMDGQTVDLGPVITNAVNNIVSSMVFGRRFERGDAELDEVVTAVRQVMNSAMNSFMMNFMPWLRFVPFMQNPEQFTDKVDEFILRKINEHRATFDATKPPRDFVDMFLQVQHGLADGDKSTFDEGNMQVIVTDFFVAGGDTISITLMWIFLFLALNKDVQDRCREEIREVLGDDGHPNMDVREKLPFVEATILESQRIGDISALGDLRNASKDVEIKGFRIPRGTVVMPLLCSVHRGAEYWPEPEKFQPTRWLDDKDGKIVRHEAFMPFSLGRRSCIGENMARVELFILTTMLLQHFSLEVPEDQPAPSTEGIIGLMRMPHNFKVIVRKVD